MYMCLGATTYTHTYTSSILALPWCDAHIAICISIYAHICTHARARVHVRYVSGRVTLDAPRERVEYEPHCVEDIYIRDVWGILRFCSVENSTHRRWSKQFSLFCL